MTRSRIDLQDLLFGLFLVAVAAGTLVATRNLAVGLGNAAYSPKIVAALQRRAADASALVREHVAWALVRQNARRSIGHNGKAPA